MFEIPSRGRCPYCAGEIEELYPKDLEEMLLFIVAAFGWELIFPMGSGGLGIWIFLLTICLILYLF